jgi:hypothetical protein
MIELPGETALTVEPERPRETPQLLAAVARASASIAGLPQVLGSPRHEGILASFFDPGEARGLDFEVGENWRRG